MKSTFSQQNADDEEESRSSQRLRDKKERGLNKRLAPNGIKKT